MKTKNPVRKVGASVLITVALIVLTYLFLPNGQSIGAAPQNPQVSLSNKALTASVRADQKRTRAALGQLPLSFEMNRGQFPAEVQFVSRGAGHKAFFTGSEMVFVLRKPGAQPSRMTKTERQASRAVVRMSLIGGNAGAVTGTDELPGKINYFRGSDEQKWIRNVPTFRKISYASVYPGIDLVYYGKGNALEYDFVVAPGADPRQIALDFSGAEQIEVDAASGALVIHGAGGAEMRQGKPLLYQEVDGVKRAVGGGFTVEGTRAGFSVGDYDRSRPLVIDPAIITYSTYLAAEADERVHDIVSDSDDNAYAVGWTESELFPTKDAYQSGQNNFTDEAFITKFNPDGSQLIWSTYLGGGEEQTDFDNENLERGDDGAYGVAIDADRNVYVTGWAVSPDFPTRNAMQPHLSDACCGSDSFITKLNTAGDQLVFSTFFGGAEGDDVGRGIALDSNRNIYVVGYTRSFAFPTTKPIQREIDGRTSHFHTNEENYDAYLAKIDASGQFRVYSTYIGGPGEDVATGVAVDSKGGAYVTGWTNSTQPEPSATGTPTPTPGPSSTATPAMHFPITDNAVQKNPGGFGQTVDAFVTKVDPAGSQYIYSTYLGGSGDDRAWGISLGVDRSAYVTGYTDSGVPSRVAGAAVQDEFPTTAGAYQAHNNGGFDAFLTRFNPSGDALVYSTLIGGDSNEGGLPDCLCSLDRIDGAAVTVDLFGRAFITGWTESTFVPDPSATPAGSATNFPTKDAFQPQPGSSPGSSSPQSRDAFVSLFDTNKSGDDSLVASSFLGGSRRDEGQAISADPGGNLFVAGWTQSDSSCISCGRADGIEGLSQGNDFPTTMGAFQESPSFGEDGWIVAFSGGATVVGQGVTYAILGQVLDTQGDPVQGVTITLTKPDNTTMVTTTDSMGLYQFANLPPVPESPYIVTPSGLGYVYTPPQRDVIITTKNERADFVASFPEPTPSVTPSPTPTATATATATATPPTTSQPVNLSTRMHVLTGDQVGIGGFIIMGSGPKHVILRAIGPSLARFGIPNYLPDPILELHGPGAFPTVTNDNWRDTQETEIKATGIPPTDDHESAIDIVLAPGSYTAIIRGKGGTTGIGLVEVYDLDSASTSKLSNISTRAFVGAVPGDSVIAGFILGKENQPDRIVVRGLGPSLAASGVPNTLQNPTLELHNGDGALLFTNNDWMDNPENAMEVAEANLAPSNNLESAIAITLPPGLYTAILAGLDGTTGNGLVEIYDRGGDPFDDDGD
jgi:hypothetical protein